MRKGARGTRDGPIDLIHVVAQRAMSDGLCIPMFGPLNEQGHQPRRECRHAMLVNHVVSQCDKHFRFTPISDWIADIADRRDACA